MEVAKKFSGLVVCGAILGWLAISDLRQQAADLHSDVEDVEYNASQLEADISSLKNSVGEETFGSSQADRIDDAERRARNAEYQATEALDQLRQLERDVSRLQITGGY